jgi:hypothetical protein
MHEADERYTTFKSENLKRRHHLADTGVAERMILKCIFKKQVYVDWIHQD